ncbi:hypothetical protein GBF38_007563, partial [Nibea albiflora]
MVHSGSASPMTTTPSASPHLTVPATAPPLQAAPDVPPPGDTTDQDLTQTPANIQSHTTDLTSNSELTQASTLSPADAEPHVITPGKALATNSDPASAWSSTQASTLAQGSVNGRTSGRKRTPKACDCCGPNSTGHNVRTSGRGRGRGRARGRGAGSDLWDTPKRKVGGQLTHIKCLDLTKEMVEEAEDEDDSYEKVQTTVVVADTQAQTPVSLPVTGSLQDGAIRNSAAPEKWDAQKKEDMLIEGSGVDGAGGKGDDDDDDDSRDVEMRLSGMAVRGRVRGGRGTVGASSASNMEVEGGFRRGGFGGGIIGLKTYSRSRLVLQRQGPNKDAQMGLGERPDPSSVKSTFGNGDTVNLSDTEPEEEAKEDNMILSEMENGLLSCSRQSRPASRSGSPQDLDSEMQVDQTPDGTDSVSLPVALSNGNITTSTNEDHRSTLMEVEPSHPPTVVLSSQGPITISSMEHHWALRDHRLYCQPGTWEKKEMEEVSGKDGEMDEMTEDEENLEQLT